MIAERSRHTFISRRESLSSFRFKRFLDRLTKLAEMPAHRDSQDDLCVLLTIGLLACFVFMDVLNIPAGVLVTGTALLGVMGHRWIRFCGQVAASKERSALVAQTMEEYDRELVALGGDSLLHDPSEIKAVLLLINNGMISLPLANDSEPAERAFELAAV